MIRCLSGSCPNEGQRLLRVVWKEPIVYPTSFDIFSDLPPLPVEGQFGGRTTPHGNSLSEDGELEEDKLECVGRFLEKVMQNTLIDESPTHLSTLREWLSHVRGSDPSFFRGRKNCSNNLLWIVDCADRVLDSFRLFFRGKKKTEYPRFMRYRIFEDEPDGILRREFHRVEESLAGSMMTTLCIYDHAPQAGWSKDFSSVLDEDETNDFKLL